MLSLSLLLIASSTAFLPGPIVQTDDGPIRGSASFPGPFVTYHGVPFAASPTGALRWKDPKRPQPWTKVKETVAVGSSCAQLDLVKGQHVGSEDCLFLSIYVPEGCTPESPCPIMQWIHGSR